MTAKIARARLNEFPDYYARLAEMEPGAEADRAAPRRVTEAAQEIAALKRAARGACGVSELGHWSWPGLLCGSLVFTDEAAEDRPALDALAVQVRDRVIWPGRSEVAAAMGPSSVVVGLVFGQDRLQMPLTEDEHPVGDLGPDGEHESFRVSVRAGCGAGSSRLRCRRQPGLHQTMW
jgi:Protein of unknown function (DUF5661)